MTRCSHWNDRGYGQCNLQEGHPPVDNGFGILYDHQYDLPRPDNWERRAMGTLDVYEHTERIDAKNIPSEIERLRLIIAAARRLHHTCEIKGCDCNGDVCQTCGVKEDPSTWKFPCATAVILDTVELGK